jgi:hypothetical protein
LTGTAALVRRNAPTRESRLNALIVTDPLRILLQKTR